MLSQNLWSGVKLKEVTDYRMNRWVKPMAKNIMNAYKKIFTKLRPELREDISYFPQKEKNDYEALKTYWSQKNSPLLKLPLKDLGKLEKNPGSLLFSRFYTGFYPYLISQAPEKNRVDLEKLWGNFVEPIITHMYLNQNKDYLIKNIDQLNLHINEIKMKWTKDHEEPLPLQKSINYIHYRWNFMLKQMLKFF